MKKQLGKCNFEEAIEYLIKRMREIEKGIDAIY